MRRREFITLLSGAAVGWPVIARAQQPAMPVIGFLSGRSLASDAHLVEAFREGLSQRGYVDGQSVAIVYRWAEGNDGQLSGLASELVDLKVNLVFAARGTPADSLQRRRPPRFLSYFLRF